MFNNPRPNTNVFGGAQQNPPFGGTQGNANVFGGNTQPQNTMFNTAGQNSNAMFNRPANTPGQTNIFGAPTNPQGQGMFNQTAPNQGANMFGGNQPQQQGMFNQNQRPNQPTNMFGQNTQQGFAQGSQQGNMFGQNTQQANMFNQGQPAGQQPNFFNQNAQQGMFNQPPMVGAGNPLLQYQVLNFANFPPEQQQLLVKNLTNDQVRKLIDHFLKSLVEPKRLENLALSSDNNLKNEKVNAMATKYNIKQQLLQVKKEVRDKVTSPIQQLKKKDKTLVNASAELAFKVTEKLQGYKERLIQAISENKMIEDIKREIGDIEGQIKDFLKPLFNAHQTRTSYSFIDPDQFSINISEQILKNISYLDNKMDELLACEGEVPPEATDTGQIIERLVEYYENVVISLREFSEKYQRQKKQALSRRKVGNTEDVMRRIAEKANMSVRKEMRAYELVKEIQQILQKREKKSTDMSLE